jgi:glycosyltransferase involved in cell wall biosynthesis
MAIHRPPANTALSQEQLELQQGATYLLPANAFILLFAHLYFVTTHPGIYAGTLVFLLTRPHPSLKARAKTLMHFGLGVYAAYLLLQRDFYELHAHFVDRTATIALIAARLLGKSYSLSIHAGADIYVEPTLLREKIVEARHAVTCTLYNRSYIETLLGKNLSQKITHIRHGLELARYRPVQNSPTRKPLILSVGQLAERKGFAQLIECCARLKEQGYDFQCQIVGQGPQRGNLEELIAGLSLQDTVSLCGALRHEDVIQKCNDATLFALLCTVTKNGDVDGIPNVIAEAMAMKLPVVSTTVSAIPELVRDGVNGLLVPPNDVDAAVAAIARLLKDQALRGELAKNGQDIVLETFDVEQNVQRFAATLWPKWFAESPLSLRCN